MHYGLQLYSVRDAAEKNFAHTLSSLSQMGYTHMEFDEFFGHGAQEVKAMLEENGLQISGAHVGMADLRANFSSLLSFHKALGTPRLILVGTRFKNRELMAQLIDDLNLYHRLLAQEGMQLCLHNHHKEFLPNLDGQVAIQQIWDNTPISFEIDTYWAYFAGKDPVKVLEGMKDRVPLIHLKDGDQEGNGFSLGEGTAPVAQVLDKAIELGMHVVVESEDLKPDGLSEVGRCMDWLKTR